MQHEQGNYELHEKSVMKVAELGRLSCTWVNKTQLILLDRWTWRKRETQFN